MWLTSHNGAGSRACAGLSSTRGNHVLDKPEVRVRIHRLAVRGRGPRRQSPRPPASAAVDPPDAATLAVTDLFDRLAPTSCRSWRRARPCRDSCRPWRSPRPSPSASRRPSPTRWGRGPLEDVGDQATLAELAGYVDGADGGGWDFTAGRPDDHPSPSASPATVTHGRRPRHPRRGRHASACRPARHRRHGHPVRLVHLRLRPPARQASLTQPPMTITTTADLPAGKQLNAGLGILGVQVVGAAGHADYGSEHRRDAWANPDNDAAGSLAFDNPAHRRRRRRRAGRRRRRHRPGHRHPDRLARRPSRRRSRAPATWSPGCRPSGPPSTSAPRRRPRSRRRGDRRGPRRGEALPHPDAARPRRRALAGGLGGPRHAGRRGRQPAADARLDRQRHRRRRRHQGLPRRPGARRRPRRPDARASRSSPRCRTCWPRWTRRRTHGSGWTIDVLGGADAADLRRRRRRSPTSPSAPPAVGSSDLELNTLGAATTGTGTYSATGLERHAASTSTGPRARRRRPRRPQGQRRRVLRHHRHDHRRQHPDPDRRRLVRRHARRTAPASRSRPPTRRPAPPSSPTRSRPRPGIAAANADLSTAKITPDVVVTLPMALDLSAPLTYVDGAGETVLDCDPEPERTAPCPFQQVDASGLGRVITSLPLAADRVLLRQIGARPPRRRRRHHLARADQHHAAASSASPSAATST